MQALFIFSRANTGLTPAPKTLARARRPPRLSSPKKPDKLSDSTPMRRRSRQSVFATTKRETRHSDGSSLNSI